MNRHEWAIKQPKLLSRKQDVLFSLKRFGCCCSSSSPPPFFLFFFILWREGCTEVCLLLMSSPMACSTLKTTEWIFYTFDFREFYWILSTDSIRD